MKVVLLKHKVDEALVARIASAIAKSVEMDVPNFIHEQQLETTNCIGFLRNDYINKNLKSILQNEGTKLIKFKKGSWIGCLIIDFKNYATYSIVTKQNLKAIPKKNGKTPHNLKTILFIENGDLHGQGEQQLLFPWYNTDFGEEYYELDYKYLVNGLIDPKDGYRHFVISYEFYKDMLINIDLVLLDKNFYEVEKRSLNEYIKPDFAKLTNTETTYSVTNNNTETNRKVPLSLKPGIGLPLNLIQKDESLESVRKNE